MNNYCERHCSENCNECAEKTALFYENEFNLPYIIVKDTDPMWLVIRVNELLEDYEPIGGMQVEVVTSNHKSTANFGTLSSSHSVTYYQTMKRVTLL